MATTLEAEELVDLGTARRTLIPRRDGEPVSPSTVWRWVRHGINGIKLRVTYVGAKPYTDSRSVRAFFDAVTEARQASQRTTEPELLVASDAELKAAGLL